MNETIRLNTKNSILIFNLEDENGLTGESLTFDMEGMDLLYNYEECVKQHQLATEWLNNQLLIVDKETDKKGKYILSKNDKKKLDILKEYYQKEEKALDLFLGENGTKKMLNGRKPYLGMFKDISDSLEPILPKLKISLDNIPNRIKEKYSKEKEDNILE